MHVFLDKSNSDRDRNVIQAANPMFLGMANRLDASLMTSLGRHIGFQDSGTWEPSNECFPG